MSYQNGPRIVTSGLALCLDAGNNKSYPGSGSVWYDISGNNRNGTINGNPTFTNGYFDITGDTTYVSISNSGLVPRTNDFTYSCWINFDAVDGLDTIFENGLWTDTLLVRHQTNTFHVYAEGAYRGTFPWTVVLNKWLNIVFKRESGIVSMFINNSSTGTPFSMTTDINLANTNLWLMRSQHITGQFTNGKIAYFGIYNKALSNTEIQQNYNALKGRFGL
jgi:hypothetical protein